jgi:multidrug resistance efflux pump
MPCTAGWRVDLQREQCSVGVQDYQAVKAGQLIVELDDADFQATVDEAQAAIAAARAEPEILFT